jgi:hypothetical protein
MPSARASGVDKLVHLLARVIGWSFSPVDDPLPPTVLPMPGPAHGPIPAIDLRLSLEAQRRRKAS